MTSSLVISLVYDCEIDSEALDNLRRPQIGGLFCLARKRGNEWSDEYQ